MPELTLCFERMAPGDCCAWVWCDRVLLETHTSECLDLSRTGAWSLRGSVYPGLTMHEDLDTRAEELGMNTSLAIAADEHVNDIAAVRGCSLLTSRKMPKALFLKALSKVGAFAQCPDRDGVFQEAGCCCPLPRRPRNPLRKGKGEQYAVFEA